MILLAIDAQSCFCLEWLCRGSRARNLALLGLGLFEWDSARKAKQ